MNIAARRPISARLSIVLAVCLLTEALILLVLGWGASIAAIVPHAPVWPVPVPSSALAFALVALAQLGLWSRSFTLRGYVAPMVVLIASLAGLNLVDRLVFAGVDFDVTVGWAEFGRHFMASSEATGHLLLCLVLLRVLACGGVPMLAVYLSVAALSAAAAILCLRMTGSVLLSDIASLRGMSAMTAAMFLQAFLAVLLMPDEDVQAFGTDEDTITEN
ncbi:hypothetical protein [Pseudooceanicola aestuarii]|uniref:hypothetical protein n=1 Tax=Pseudooceanicola aestuarii TaxID=2697319 RepID=UPI0013D40A51|nr:hypothetical protein [Pseudooceanicola aestuarii]